MSSAFMFRQNRHLVVGDEQLISSSRFPAYKRGATQLDIPCISASTVVRQHLQVSYDEIHRGLPLDARNGIASRRKPSA